MSKETTINLYRLNNLGRTLKESLDLLANQNKISQTSVKDIMEVFDNVIPLRNNYSLYLIYNNQK